MDIRNFLGASHTLFLHGVHILYKKVEEDEAPLALAFSATLLRIRCVIVVCRMRFRPADRTSALYIDMLALLTFTKHRSLTDSS